MAAGLYWLPSATDGTQLTIRGHCCPRARANAFITVYQLTDRVHCDSTALNCQASKPTQNSQAFR